MAAIKVLLVGDGPFMDTNPQTNPPQFGISFLKDSLGNYVQDTSDNTFTVSELIYLLTTSTPSISVDTAPGATIRTRPSRTSISPRRPSFGTTTCSGSSGTKDTTPGTTGARSPTMSFRRSPSLWKVAGASSRLATTRAWVLTSATNPARPLDAHVVRPGG